MRVQALAQSAGLSSDYTRLLCHSLERGGYIKFADANACCLLTRGRNRFQNNGPAVETAQHDSIVNAEPVVVSASERNRSSSLTKKVGSKAGDEKSEEIQNKILEEKLRKMQSKMKSDNRKRKAKKRKKKSSQRQANPKKKLRLKGLPQVKVKKKKARTKQREKPEKNALENFQDASAVEKEKLADAGYKTAEDLAQYPISRLIQDIGVSLKKAANWINQARRKTGAIHDEKVKSKK